MFSRKTLIRISSFVLLFFITNTISINLSINLINSVLPKFAKIENNISHADSKKATTHVSDEIIVKYKVPMASTLESKHGLKLVKANGKTKSQRFKVPAGKTIETLLNDLQSDSNIDFIQPNYIYTIDATSNDPNYSSQWHLPDIKANSAWDVTKGSSSIKIAVVDSGVKSNHPDLVANLLPGYNTITDSTNSNDDNGHGTHVAGIAAGVIDNSTGISGVAGKCKIIPVKAMNSSGSGTDADIADGITWAADNGANVINLSLGMYSNSPNMQSAIDYAHSKGCVVVAAAGNDNSSSLSYPASCNNVISVSALTNSNSKASFSNYGTTVDVAAPGENIFSCTYDGSYGLKSGTSMACPVVSGVAALILSANPSLSPSQVETILKTTATDLGTSGRDNYFGFGLVNADSAVRNAAGLPIVTPTPTNTPSPTPTRDPNASNTPTPTTSPKSDFISGISSSPNPFKVTGKTYNTISFSVNGASTVVVKFYDKNDTLVLTSSSATSTGSGKLSFKWNGVNSSGSILNEGIYTYVIEATDVFTGTVYRNSGTVYVYNGTSSCPIQISNNSCDKSIFVPNGTETSTFTYSTSGIGKITTEILYGTKTIKKINSNSTKQAGDYTFTWNGMLSKTAAFGDGTYTYRISATNMLNVKSTPVTGTFIVDTGAPKITLGPAIKTLIANGTNKATITYKLSEESLVTLKVYDSSSQLVNTLVSSVQQAISNKVTWDGKNSSGSFVPNGTYTCIISATDSLGNISSDASFTIPVYSSATEIQNSALSSSIFSSTTSSISITYTLPSSCFVTTQLYKDDTLIGTLEKKIAKTADSYSVSLDGKIASKPLSSGTYVIKLSTLNAGKFTSTPTSLTFTIQ